MSTIVLSIISFLQKIDYKYIYIALIIYFILLWISLIIWVINDSKERYNSSILRFIVIIFTSITSILGLIIYILVRPPIKDDEISLLEEQYLRYEAYGKGQCNICKFDLRPEFSICPECGDRLRDNCKKCSKLIDLNWKICPFCGIKLQTKEKQDILPKSNLFKNSFKNLTEYISKINKFLFVSSIDTTPVEIKQKDNSKKNPNNNDKKPAVSTKDVKAYFAKFKHLLFEEEPTKK